jgi:hypothetical protein
MIWDRIRPMLMSKLKERSITISQLTRWVAELMSRDPSSVRSTIRYALGIGKERQSEPRVGLFVLMVQAMGGQLLIRFEDGSEVEVK